mgnify:FL=1
MVPLLDAQVSRVYVFVRLSGEDYTYLCPNICEASESVPKIRNYNRLLLVLLLGLPNYKYDITCNLYMSFVVVFDNVIEKQ